MMGTIVKLEIPGGGATPGPPVATKLGSRGVNTRDFCLQFNALTQKQKGKILRVLVDIHEDKRFGITIKGEPVANLIKQEINIKKGSSEPNRKKVGKLSQASLEKIIQVSGDNVQGFSLDAKKNILMGIARSMGVDVEN